MAQLPVFSSQPLLISTTPTSNPTVDSHLNFSPTMVSALLSGQVPNLFTQTSMNSVITTNHSKPSISLTNPANFSMTAAITGALCSNPAIAGPHLLPACGPLLQLAVRQALGACLPTFNQLSIRGTLELAVATDQNTECPNQSTTVIKFTDGMFERRPVQEFVQHSPSIPEMIKAMSQKFMPEVTSSNTPGQCVGSSKRKSSNPTKCNAYELSGFSDMALVSPPVSSTTTALATTSGPTSPSADSGVLDLSRNGSLAGSAPMTPLKEQSTSDNFLQAYQKQLAAIGQLQSIWSRNSIHHNSEAVTSSVQQTSGPQFENNNAQASPSSPSRPAKRPRVTPVRNTNRSCTVRRSNTNRRFPCNQCRDEFPSLHTLEEHTMFVHGTYRCHICKAQFTQRSNLQRHALKHVGFKPFECRVCCKAYYRKDHLMRHMEMGHPGYTPRENITVHLTSSESLEFLNRTCLGQVFDHAEDLDNAAIENEDSFMESNRLADSPVADDQQEDDGTVMFSPVEDVHSAGATQETHLRFVPAVRNIDASLSHGPSPMENETHACHPYTEPPTSDSSPLNLNTTDTD